MWRWRLGTLSMVLMLVGTSGFIAAGAQPQGIGAAAQAAMLRESLPRGILLGRLGLSATLLFLGAMAPYVLHIANEIVLIGFTVALITIVVFAVVTEALGGNEIFARIVRPPEDK